MTRSHGIYRQKIESRYSDSASGARYFQTRLQITRRGYDLIAAIRADKFQPFGRPADCVLEYGVGTGWNLALLQARSRVGYDINPAGRESVLERGVKFTSDISLLPLQAFDIVICNHVLEHVPTPAETLEK